MEGESTPRTSDMGSDASRDTSGQWDVTFLPHGRVTIESVKYQEFLFASEVKRNYKSRQVVTWIPGFDASTDPSGQFELGSLGRGVVTLKNVKYQEHLFAGVQKLDHKRRLVLSWIPGFDPRRDTTGQWLFQAIRHWGSAAVAELGNQSAVLFDEPSGSANESESVLIP